MTYYTDSETAKASIEFRLTKDGIKNVMKSTIVKLADDYGVTVEWAQQVANDAGFSIVPDTHWVSDVEGSVTNWTSNVICAEYDVFIKVERAKRGRDRLESDAALIKRVSALAENYMFTAFKQEGKPNPALWLPSFELRPEITRTRTDEAKASARPGMEAIFIKLTFTLQLDVMELNLITEEDLQEVFDAVSNGFAHYMRMKIMASNRQMIMKDIEHIEGWGFDNTPNAADFMR